MSAENILQRLHKVRKTGLNKWCACCPAHEDNSPSLAIRELDDGRILIYCFAGCGINEILDAIGLDASDLYPPILENHYLQKNLKPWSAMDALIGLASEVLVVLQIANSILNGVPISDDNRKRLLVAITRIQRASGVAA